MSLSPLLLRGENFDGTTEDVSFIQNWPSAGKNANNVHTLRLRAYNAAILEYTPASGGEPVAALTAQGRIQGFFGAGAPVISGETFDEYMSSLEWFASDYSGTWLQINVPGSWSPLPSSQTIHSLTSWPGTGTNSYRFRVRKGTNVLIDRTVSWVS